MLLLKDFLTVANPWVILSRDRLPEKLKLESGDRAAILVTTLALPLLAIAILHGRLFWLVFGAALFVAGVLQIRVFRHLADSRGAIFALSRVPLLLAYNLKVAASAGLDSMASEIRGDRWLVPAAAASAALILGLQIAGGAYKAEFDGDPDESAHLVSSLAVYDYIVTQPHENPITWATRYYLHYPKLAIGHWPPGYYMIEAAWWLLFPPSRISAMALNFAMMLLVAILFYRLARRIAPPWIALAAVFLLIAAPVAQASYDENMAELSTLLWSVLLIGALCRLAVDPSLRSASLVALWLACALGTKATAVGLVPAPFLVVLATGNGRLLVNRRILTVGAILLLCGCGWLLLQGTIFSENFRNSAGLGVGERWRPYLIPSLVGYGFFALACGGMLSGIARRSPMALGCSAMLAGIATASWFLRAMAESRHYIVILPALLLLSLEFLVYARQKHTALTLVGLAGLALFPFSLKVQKPAGYEALLLQVPRPARMVVSSNDWGDGPWIAEVALHEKRTSSVVVRANKLFAASDWDSKTYRLLVNTPAEVERRLDALRIDMVIVEARPGKPDAPHQALLKQALADQEWNPFASAGVLRAYRRTKPPLGPREPLRIDLKDKIGRVIEEH
jgi:hypothetical protein